MHANNVLDDPSRALAIDRSRMRDLLEGFPHHLEGGWGLGEDVEIPPFERLLICGMGGSAIGGDFLRAYLQQKGFHKPLEVVRGYRLPPLGDAAERTLVYALSYSGNTEETLACFEDAGRRGCPRIAITSGGRLAQLAHQQKVPVIEIPGGMPPRTALGYLLAPLLRSLLPALRRSQREAIEREFAETVGTLRSLSPLYAEEPEAENPAKRQARALFQKIPIIYGSAITEPIARRWKCQINENAKQPAYWDVLPELHHNEIVGWEWGSPLAERFVYVLLRDPETEEHPQIQKRFRITRALLEERGRTVLEVRPPDETQGLLARLLSLSYLGDWVSYYLALLNGVDPTPVELIEAMKRRLAEG